MIKTPGKIVWIPLAYTLTAWRHPRLADISITKALPPEVQQMMQLSIRTAISALSRLVRIRRQKTPERNTTKSRRATLGPGQDAK
ncbi:hypothetical protein ACNKHK_09250 [Shigella flexneri]